MTYCVAMNLKDGLIFASDTRTNAGIDHISIYQKLFYFKADDRELVIQSAGNLATTQSVIAKINLLIKNDTDDNILKKKTIFEIAQIVGTILRNTVIEAKSELIDTSTLSCSLMLGGYINNQTPELYNIYTEGNFITSNYDTPYFQIGENKYGKPIIDRIVNYNTDLENALKCTMISFDSTIMSNLSVGLPIDIVVMDRKKQTTIRKRITKDNEYMLKIRHAWGQLIKENFDKVPAFPLD
ncbi:MAG: peptidase [Succinivibrionaceae bacterium]